jgi:hypothetical protein
MVRPSHPYDLYYYDSETSKHQAFPTTFNTRYYQDFQNRSGGTSSFILPPQNGYTDVVCTFKFKNPNNATAGAIALPRGWGYALLDSVSYRYGGSSQYFVSNDQILQNALRAQTSRSSCNDILTLGGNYATGLDLSNNVVATVVLTLPHNHPCGSGKKNPFPSDLLTQQILVQVNLKSPGSIFTNQTGNPLPAWCLQLDSAQFGVAQLMLNNQGDSLARRVDMSTSAYAYPAEFVQQVVRITGLQATTSEQPVVLTGFRAGQVKSLEMWLTRGVDLASSATSGSAVGYNPFNWILPASVKVTYSGEVFSNFQNSSSPLWNLINGNKSPAFDNVVISGAGGAINANTSAVSQWVSCPFAQPLVDEDAHFIQISGRNITNGIVNVDLATPTARSDWVLNVSYVYACTILMSSGTADFVF